MRRHLSTVASLGLIGSGIAVCMVAAKPLLNDPALRLPPNPLGIKMSPYGEVLAMAMQGPIDLYWHGGSEDCEDPDCPTHAHGQPGHECESGIACDHDHRKADPTLATATPRSNSGSLRDQYRAFLENLNDSVSTRTNPRSATQAHKFHLRRQIEDKLRFAYQLDPSHYGNYSSYHFFITEPEVGTRPELTRGAKQLADATIAYCLAQNNDPRPALTAAAAANNVLELMFSHPERHSTAAMREQLGIVDQALSRYLHLLDQAESSGQWNLLSPLRQDETTERYRFLSRVRDAAEATIRRLEGLPPTQQARH